MKRIGIFQFVLLAGLLGGASVVQAADFTFTVPVDVSNLPPEITHITACCYVTVRAEGRMVGHGPCATKRPVSEGAYRGSFVVENNALPGVDPATADYYICYAKFDATVDGERVDVAGQSGGLPLPLSSGALNMRGDISR